MKQSADRSTLSLESALKALAVAPLGGLAVWAICFGVTRQYDIIDAEFTLIILAIFSYTVAALLVLPVLITVPSTRCPRRWLGALWGAGVAITAAYGPLMFERSRVLDFDVLFNGIIVIAGAASGLVYAVLARLAAEADKASASEIP